MPDKDVFVVVTVHVSDNKYYSSKGRSTEATIACEVPESALKSMDFGNVMQSAVDVAVNRWFTPDPEEEK